VAGVILFGGRGMRIPGLITEDPTNAIANTKESPDNIATMLTGAIATYLKIDKETTRELKDGLFYKMTGLSSARTSNMPLPSLGQGNEIFSSIVMKKFGPLITNILGNATSLEGFQNYVTSGGLASDIVGMVTSQDTEIAGDIGAYGKRFDSKGGAVDIDAEKHPLAHAPGVDFTKNMPASGDSVEGVKLMDAPKNIVKKYQKLDDKEFFKRENIKGLVMQLKDIYKGDPTMIKSTVKRIIRDRLVPKGGEIFSELSGVAKTYNSVGNMDLVAEEPALKRLSKDQVIEQAALSVLTQRNSYNVIKLLVAAKKLDMSDPEQKKALKAKIKEIKGKIK
jgi:hypothetical protein